MNDEKLGEIVDRMKVKYNKRKKNGQFKKGFQWIATMEQIVEERQRNREEYVRKMRGMLAKLDETNPVLRETKGIGNAMSDVVEQM